jgi:hypothetical protein
MFRTLQTLAIAALALAAPAAAQFDPAFNHLKCYQIKDKPIVKTIVVDTQFGRERIVKLTPVMLCAPAKKTCCANAATVAGCNPVPCPPDPVPQTAVPHFKCYKIAVKTCTDAAGTPVDCTTLAKFAKKVTQVNLHDQFGDETVLLGGPRMLCAPVVKTVISPTTTTTTIVTTTTTIITTTTSTSTTTTTLPCHFDLTSPTHCSGPCPAGAPPGSQCVVVAPQKCDCLPPPVCCECGAAGCFDINGQCPVGCFGVPGATCNPATGDCGCGYCREAGTAACLQPLIPCSPNDPCPQGTICDPVNCPRPCGGPCDQPAGQCTADQCFRTDGTAAVCRPTPFNPCSCCGPSGASCSTDFDCCSGICNAGVCS